MLKLFEKPKNNLPANNLPVGGRKKNDWSKHSDKKIRRL